MKRLLILLLLLMAPVQAAPAFHVERQGGAWWLVAPDGHRFFSLGVCCVDPGTAWNDYTAANPSYAAWQHYASPLAWADATVKRLKTWGFTTIGGWSDLHALRQSKAMDLSFTVFMPLAMANEGPWADMWDAQRVQRMDKLAHDTILPVRNDARCIGYFTDNEQGWWNIGLWQSTLKQAAGSGQRQRLLQLLRQKYDWRGLLRDFVVTGASDFRSLSRGGMLYLRPGGNGLHTIQAFATLVASRYYQLCHDIIRKYDRRGLILGDRYQSFYYPCIARAAAPYVDVISTNVNPFFQDGSGTHWYLDTLHALTGRPVMITEYYACAMENGSGDPNSSSGFLTVPTQAERAKAFARSLQWFASCPYVIGADWFQYWDEAPKGRSDGENYNMGLVDVHDVPYDALVAAVPDLAHLHAQSHAVAVSGIPPAPEKPMAGSDDKTMMLAWDREQGWLSPSTDSPQADLYACWDAGHLYLGIHAIDVVEKGGWQGGVVPEVDRMRLDVDGVLHARLGAGLKPVLNTSQVIVAHHSGFEHDCRNVTMLQIPATLLHCATLSPGQRIRLDVHLTGCARGWQEGWQVDTVLK